MKRLILTLVLAFACTAVAAPRVAKECKRPPCKQAFNQCIRQTCSRFHGALKHGCARGLRLTLRSACTVSGDYARFCNEVQTEGCNGD